MNNIQSIQRTSLSLEDQSAETNRPASPKPWFITLSLQVAFTISTFTAMTPAAVAQEDLSHVLAAVELSVDELMLLKITSVSKKQQSIFEAPAAVSVITSDDIRRSGATSLPEALRLAPGLQVARAGAHTWAISARGFNGVFSNKLLVLVDGRSIYNPLFSGVDWDVQDMALEDLERIEVVRGPGATLWGANAVNGVINIITKSTKDTQGTLLSAGVGTEELGRFTIRHGGVLSENAWYRVYGMYRNRDDSKLSTGSTASDQANIAKGGFRIDWEPGFQNKITIQGDAYSGGIDETVTFLSPTAPFPTMSMATADIEGANLLGRWNHSFSESSELTVQSYFDYFARTGQAFGQSRSTGDIEIQHRLGLGDRNELNYGGNYRVTRDDIDDSFQLDISPEKRTLQLFSAFIQNEFSIVPETLSLTVGSKFEHNDFTGFEYQPSARLLWTPNEKNALWTSISRAVRTPSRVESDLQVTQAVIPPGAFPFNPTTPTFQTLLSSRQFNSEDLLSMEAGHRIKINDRLSLELSGFYNEYDGLRSLEPGVPFPVPNPLTPTNWVLPIREGNTISAETYGGELNINLQVSEGWRLRSFYNFINIEVHKPRGSGDITAEADEGATPTHQISLRSQHDLPQNLELDIGIQYIDGLPSLGVPKYFLGDIRLGWRPSANWEFSIVGQNLFDTSHGEFFDQFGQRQRSEIQHAVYANITRRF